MREPRDRFPLCLDHIFKSREVFDIQQREVEILENNYAMRDDTG